MRALEEKLSTAIIQIVSPNCQFIGVTLEFPLDPGTDLQPEKFPELPQLRISALKPDVSSSQFLGKKTISLWGEVQLEGEK